MSFLRTKLYYVPLKFSDDYGRLEEISDLEILRKRIVQNSGVMVNVRNNHMMFSLSSSFMTHIEFVKSNLPKQKFFRVNFWGHSEKNSDASIIIIHSHGVIDVFDFGAINKKDAMKILKKFECNHIIKLSWKLYICKIKEFPATFDKVSLLGMDVFDLYHIKHALDNWNFRYQPKFSLGKTKNNSLMFAYIHGFSIPNLIFAEEQKNIGDGKIHVNRKIIHYKISNGQNYIYEQKNESGYYYFDDDMNIIIRGKDNIEILYISSADAEHKKMKFTLNEDPVIDKIIGKILF